MPNMDQALVSRLEDFAGLASLISKRVYPVVLKQGATIPAVVYQRIGTGSSQAHGQAAALPRVRYQITSFGSSLSEAKAVAAQVKLALDGQHAAYWGSGTYRTWIEASLWKDESDAVEAEVGLYYVQQDFLIQHRD